MSVYTWKCDNCGKEFENEIPMSEYTKVKDSQKCPDCNNHATRTWIMDTLTIKNCEGTFDRDEKGKEFTMR